jgi:ribosome biogenesis GTPase
MSDLRPGLLPGTVLRSAGGVYDIQLAEGGMVEASLRGRLKTAYTDEQPGRRHRGGGPQRRADDRVVAGDRVHLLAHGEGSYTIEATETRRSQLARRSPGSGRGRPRIMVANVDQVVVVVAAAHPEPHLRMLDRFLVLAEAATLPALIVVNKADLVAADALATTFGPYPAAGYTVCYTSVVQGSGLDALRAQLCGKESVLTGASGVGKSSLLNAIEPGLGLRVSEVSKAVGKGKHTTVTAQLVPLACGGYVADTPGLREVGLWEVERDELDSLFPEFRPFLGQCRFDRSCTHTHEPGCAVRRALAEERIDRGRYDSYVLLREHV